MTVSYDLHIHSCLSPCGDMDMTPNNIVNMAMLQGLQVIALTDHNACGNCAAAMAVGRRQGILVVPGMELTLAEDVHAVCLFPGLEEALAFEALVRARHPIIANNTDIFGEQLILDENDAPVGSEDRLLITATDIGSFEIAALCREYGGVATPAHVDKQANSIVNTLGFLTPDMGFVNVELSRNVPPGYLDSRPDMRGMGAMHNSDAHYLWDISDGTHQIELERMSARAVVEALQTPLL